MRKIVLGLLLVSGFHPVYAEWTDVKKIDEIKIREATGTAYYFTAIEGGWGAAGCPNAGNVAVSQSLSVKESILSAVLAAKMAGSTVRFSGVCVNDTVFSADYVVIK